MLEDACEAPGAVDADGVTLGARGHLTTFAFYANKQLTTGEGGMIVPRSSDEAAELRSARNQGRAIDMDWLDHDRLGFNYRMTDIQAALGIAQVEKADELLAARSRVAAAYTERLSALGGAPAGEGDPDGFVLPCADRGDERRSWFVYTVRVPKGHDREAVIADLAQRGVASKAYLPCIHLMPHYRERFGFSGGEFPVAEEVAERSMALPFFPAMTDDQIETVSSTRCPRRWAQGTGPDVPLHAETLVETPAEIASLAALRDATGETDGVMERHCLRCFLLCELLAEKHNADLDREVMLCAAFLHDIGLYDKVSEGGVYTDEGGEFARKLGLEHGWDERRADLCAEACANHHAVRSQWEQGAEVETLRLADRIEVSGGLSRGGLSRDADQGRLRRGPARRLLRRARPRRLARTSARARSRPLRIFKPLMGRLDQPQDPLFKRINTSVGFDQRLWPQDIAGSIAHARALERAGVLTDDELGQMVRRASSRCATSSRRRRSTSQDDDEDIHMAVERRLTEIVGAARRQAPHRPLAERPGGDRPGAVRLGVSRASGRA